MLSRIFWSSLYGTEATWGEHRKQSFKRMSEVRRQVFRPPERQSVPAQGLEETEVRWTRGRGLTRPGTWPREGEVLVSGLQTVSCSSHYECERMRHQEKRQLDTSNTPQGNCGGAWVPFEDGLESSWLQLRETEAFFQRQMHQMSGQSSSGYRTQTDSATTTAAQQWPHSRQSSEEDANSFLQEMSRTMTTTRASSTSTLREEWHEGMCCEESDHEAVEGEWWIVVPQSYQDRLQMVMQPKYVSGTKLTAMAARTETRKVGGALFQDPDYWIRVMPNTKAARWQLRGGVDWRLRRTKQQSVRRERRLSDEDKEELAEEMAALVGMGVYVDVPQSEDEEERERQLVRDGSWDELQKKSRSLTTSGRQSTGKDWSSSSGCASDRLARRGG